MPGKIRKFSNFVSTKASYEEIEQELVNLKTLLSGWQAKATELNSEIELIRTQTNLEIEQVKKRSKKELSEDIQDLVNNFVLAFNYAPKSQSQEVDKFVVTLKNVINKAVETLKTKSVELIIPEIGAAFDPQVMQALNSASTENPVVNGLVSVGLAIESQLIKPAVVMLA